MGAFLCFPDWPPPAPLLVFVRQPFPLHLPSPLLRAPSLCVCACIRYTQQQLRESLQASKLVWVYIAIVVLLSAGLVAAVVFGVRWHRRNLAMHIMLAKHAERCALVLVIWGLGTGDMEGRPASRVHAALVRIMGGGGGATHFFHG